MKLLGKSLKVYGKRRTVTSENARSELQSFLQDYSEERLQQKEEKQETFQENVKAVAEDLSKAVNPQAVVEVAEDVQKAIQESKEDSSNLPKKMKDVVDKGSAIRLKNFIKKLPTPSGISLILFIILFILFAIQPVANGNTRLQLMWRSLLGTAYITRYDPNKKDNTVEVEIEDSTESEVLDENVPGYVYDFGVQIGSSEDVPSNLGQIWHMRGFY